MIKPIKDSMLGPNQSRYSFVVGIAKRAREISAEAEAKGDILIVKPVDLALDDYAQHKFKIIETPEPNDDDTEA
ncbi:MULTISPECIES: DNA-directed RNA polymerase subunit omega [Eubacteriales]|uniref:DNA-directed RNA polymerase subunit omega n=1 Tax=Eubacteriales TaxID=186802 RepID=UPI0006809EFB|nr:MULTISPECIES: DNA-directed RNA polymerase subunit omega [Eubacteriales]